MIAVSKVTITDKRNESVKISEWILHKNGKDWIEKVHTEPYSLCKEGDELGIISKFDGFEGVFYIVANKKNVTFIIKEDDLEISDNFEKKEDELIYQSRTINFIDFIEQFNFF